MKLIIDIPDTVYERILKDKYKGKPTEAETDLLELLSATENGIPLDKIRAEIKANMESIIGKYGSNTPTREMPSAKIERNNAREECLQIIDKYRGEQP